MCYFTEQEAKEVAGDAPKKDTRRPKERSLSSTRDTRRTSPGCFPSSLPHSRCGRVSILQYGSIGKVTEFVKATQDLMRNFKRESQTGPQAAASAIVVDLMTGSYASLLSMTLLSVTLGQSGMKGNKA